MTEHEDRAEQPEEHAGANGQIVTSADTARPVGRGLALLALLVALLAAGVAGWTGWQSWREDTASDAGDRLEALSSRVDRLAGETQSLNDELSAVAERADAAADRASAAERSAEGAADRAEALDRSVSGLAEEVASLQQKLNDQGRRLDTLATRVEDRGERDPGLALGLAQAEYLVHAAYRILELERDPTLAARALSLAADRLSGLEAPGLTRVREAVAGELEALRGVAEVDREGLAARLAGLAETAGRLPLRGELGPAAATRSGSAKGPDAADAERGWWQATREFMGEYFTVRRTDETGTSLPASGTLTLMRDVLRLALEQARLALLRGEAGLYRQSLERADGLLASYFAEDDPAVAAARETIAELREARVAPRLPEVGQALEALRAVNPDSAGSP